MSIRLSVVIITLNEEKNIGRCLDSIRDIADDIVIVDSGSTDATKTICSNSSKLQFIHQPWLGSFSKQKNTANSFAKGDYILSIDADEALSPKLINSIQEFKKNPIADIGLANRLTNYCGKWIHHSSWYPDRKPRLWKKEIAQWKGDIHEEVQFDANKKKIKLKGDILHYSFYSIQDHVKKVNYFTDLVSKNDFDKGKRSNLLKIVLSPFVKFFKDYFIKLGFMDGYYGFVICMISSHATFIKYIKLRELQKNSTS